jgi:hypothetical protein
MIQTQIYTTIEPNTMTVNSVLRLGWVVGTISLALWFEEKTKLLNNRNITEQDRALYLFFLAAAAFRIIAAHFVASASDSNPKTAEYFLPTTWATRKSMLIPAPAMACAVA